MSKFEETARNERHGGPAGGGLMYGRVIRLKGDPGKREEAMKLWKETTLPAIKKQPGFLGISMVGNRQTGDGLSVSYWETEHQTKQAREQVRPIALKNLEKTGGQIAEEDEVEVFISKRFKPAKSGVWVRVTTLQSDPAKLEQGIAEFKQKILPKLEGQTGCRGGFLMGNRSTGKSFGGSWWETEEDLKNSEAAIVDTRREIVEHTGGKSAKTEAFEVLYTEILATAQASREEEEANQAVPGR